MRRLLFVVGTRPEAIKLAPLVHACRAQQLDTIVCLSGQHRQLLAGTLDSFGIFPDIDLEAMQAGQSLSALTARCLAGLDRVIDQRRPHAVVAQGDTSTAAAAAMAAFYRRLPLVHVEAGLRTGDMAAPWPEEFNRRLATLAATLHCAPTAWAADNLRREGVPEPSIHVTGNTAIDALLWTLARQQNEAQCSSARHPWLGQRRLVLVTGHRRENLGPGLVAVCQAVARLAAEFPDVAFAYPVHLNPLVGQTVHRLLAHRDNVILLPPLAYPEFVWMLARSTLILTDSGGVQEEAPSLGKPVLVMRDKTERPEAIEAGAAQLVGCDPVRIVAAATRLLTDPAAYTAMQIQRNPYGDGRAAERIARLIARADW